MMESCHFRSTCSSLRVHWSGLATFNRNALSDGLEYLDPSVHSYYDSKFSNMITVSSAC